jgi:GH35 family endo-1,4-beta-xylanase
MSATRPDVPAPGALDARIRQVRSADVTLTLHDREGRPLANEDVVVAQRSHRFGFGCNGFEAVPLANAELAPDAAETAQAALAKWLDLFNAATLPFYWGRFEPQRGHPDTARLRKAAAWFVERGCRVKGHPLCWHTITADWLLDLPDDEIVEAQLDRIRRDVAAFAGLVDSWDVINEVVIMPTFDKYDNGISRMCRRLGQAGIVRATFDAAREANPSATLLLNDFDVSFAYEELIERCLEAGIAIDALGIQSHMHQGWWGEEKTRDVLRRFGRFGLPLHFTETTLISGRLMPPEIEDLNDYQVDDWPSTPDGEARQAEEVVLHYRILLSDPAVESITWWDLADGQWLNAPSGLLRRDGTPKPAYEALHRLVKGDWWLPPTTLRTGDDGTLHFSGFLGDYTLLSRGRTVGLHLDRPGAVAMDLALEAAEAS